MNPSRILVRATNWVGDAVMSVPALQEIRKRYPDAHIAIMARPWVADLYARESFADEVIRYTSPRGFTDLKGKWKVVQDLRARKFDMAILLQNAFEAAVLVWLAGIPRTLGYSRDGRGFLLTQPIRAPKKGEIPPHQRFYYLELLRRAVIIGSLPDSEAIRLGAADEARVAGATRFQATGIRREVVGVSPGAAYGTAKRWLPESFAAAAAELAIKMDAAIALFGSKDERELCERIAETLRKQSIEVHNYAGSTTLSEFIDLCAACSVYLTNDSGAMHIASALGVPTVAVFGATDDVATGPTGLVARVVRHAVECSPCLLRECPIDHRCMTRVDAHRVAETALELLK